MLGRNDNPLSIMGKGVARPAPGTGPRSVGSLLLAQSIDHGGSRHPVGDIGGTAEDVGDPVRSEDDREAGVPTGGTVPSQGSRTPETVMSLTAARLRRRP